jgi:hypothetical protein
MIRVFITSSGLIKPYCSIHLCSSTASFTFAADSLFIGGPMIAAASLPAARSSRTPDHTLGVVALRLSEYCSLSGNALESKQ